MSDLNEQIQKAANQPKQVTVDGTTVQNQSIPDLIKADDHLAKREAIKAGKRPFKILKGRAPGTV